MWWWLDLVLKPVSVVGNYTVGHFKQPRSRLIALDPNYGIREVNYYDTGWKRKFVHLHVQNSKQRTAKRPSPS